MNQGHRITPKRETTEVSNVEAAPSKESLERARKLEAALETIYSPDFDGDLALFDTEKIAREFDAIARERDEVTEKLAEATDLQAALRKACEEAVEVCIYSLDDTAYANEYQIRKFTDIIERHLTPVFEALLQHAPKDTSDGFHTFQELYEHRYALFAVVCKLCGGWKSKQHADGTMFEDSFIAGVLTPKGQATYHMPLRLWDEFPAKEIEHAPEYDGHTPEDVIQRLALLSVEALRDSVIEETERSAAMTDLEKELVEKLAKAWVGTEQNPWDLVSEEQRKSWEALCIEGYLPHIRSHTQALVAAAYAACAKTCLGNVLSEEQMNGEPNLHVGEMCLRLCHERDAAAIRKLTPADAARELERRDESVRADTIMRFRKVLDRLDIHGYYNEMQREFGCDEASLTKPAPVKRSNEND